MFMFRYNRYSEYSMLDKRCMLAKEIIEGRALQGLAAI